MTLLRIPLSETWQAINLAANYKNNINTRIWIGQSADAAHEPSTDDGIVISAYGSFKIPSDGSQYWAKTLHGTGEIVQDPTVIASSGIPAGTVFEIGATGTFAGSTSYTEITLSSDPGATFQVVITAIGDETVVADVGGITVEYVSSTVFRVYNSGLAGSTFNWVAFVN